MAGSPGLSIRQELGALELPLAPSTLAQARELLLDPASSAPAAGAASQNEDDEPGTAPQHPEPPWAELKVIEPLHLQESLEFAAQDTTTTMTWELAFGGLLLPGLSALYVLTGRNPKAPDREHPEHIFLGHIAWEHRYSYMMGAVLWFGVLAALAVYATKLPKPQHGHRVVGWWPILVLVAVTVLCLEILHPGFFLDLWPGLCGLAALLGMLFLGLKDGVRFLGKDSVFWYDTILVPGFFMLVAPVVPAVWVVGHAWHDSESLPNKYGQLLIRLVITGICGPISMTCYWTMRRPSQEGWDRELEAKLQQKYGMYTVGKKDIVLTNDAGGRVWALGPEEETLGEVRCKKCKGEMQEPSPSGKICTIKTRGLWNPTCHEPAECSCKSSDCDYHLCQMHRKEAEPLYKMKELEELGERQRQWFRKQEAHQTAWLCKFLRKLLSRHKYLHLFAEQPRQGGRGHGQLFRCRISSGFIGVFEMVLDAFIEATFTYVVIQFGSSSYSSSENPCESPVQNQTACGVPCMNVVNWWTSTFSYVGPNGTVPFTSSPVCTRFPEVVDLGMLFQCVSLGIMIITCFTGYHQLFKLWCSFQAMTDAVQIYLWQFDRGSEEQSVNAAQEEFVKHMISIRSHPVRQSERNGLLTEYHLDWLPLVPSRTAVEKLRQEMERGRQPWQGPGPSASHELEGEEQISWAWWFRYRKALLETVEFYYWRVWFVLVGLLVLWVCFVMDMLVSAGLSSLTSYEQTITKDFQAILYSLILFGFPVMAGVVLGAWVNQAMDDSLDAIQSFVQTVEDKQYLEWAQAHPRKLQLCHWAMDLKMVLTAAASIASGLLVLVVGSG